ncbi:MAG: flagellar hook-length control protein FliK, partial [Herbinix sp.]|nr:flagellar hook-length control protein FliK [Herbinix sp.]
LMYKNNLPMTKENIKQFEAYQSGTNKLLNDINSITKNISELLKSPQDVSTDSVPSLAEDKQNYSIAQGLSNKDNAIESDPSTPEAPVQPEVLSNSQDTLKKVLQINGKLIDILYNDSTNSTNVTLGNPLGSLLSPEELTVLGKAIEQKIADQTQLPANIPSDLMQQVTNGILSLDDTMKLINYLSLPADNQAGTVITKLLDQFAPLQDNIVTIADTFNLSERTTLLEYMGDFPDDSGIKSQIENGSVTLQKLLTYIHQNLAQSDNKTAMKLLQAPEYSKLMENAFLQKWTLTPEKIAKKTPVQELYQNLQEDIEKLSQLSKEGKASSETLQIRESLKNLQENVTFMKDLNQMITYLGLPVQLKDQKLHSELYVYTRKKALQESPDNISVLLHLDMTHLGSLNIHIQMSHSLIQAKFCAEDKEAGQIIAKNIPLLEEALGRKGYELHAELVDTYEKPDFSKDFIEENSLDTAVKRYTFDIRT